MKSNTEEISLEERKVVAFEKMAKAFEKIGGALEEKNDYMQDVGLIEWSERLEWYLNEFYQLIRTKTKGSETRPPRDVERIEEKSFGEESKS